MSKFVTWLGTEYGKLTTGLLGFAAYTSFSMSTWLPNTILLEKYKEIVQLYKNGFPVSVPKNVMKLVEQVENDMKAKNQTDSSAPKTEYFTVLGFDLFNAGSTTYRTGSLIGLPLNFSYQSQSGLDKKSIMVGNKSVHWTTPEGLALESSLLLTDEAKKFGIAREITAINSHHVTAQTALNGGCGLLYYYLSYSFIRRAGLLHKPFRFRVVLKSLLGGFILTLWLFLTDFTTIAFEEKADKEACNLGIDYTRGAAEFYSKILQRNMALRSLLGSDGADLYTATGNDRIVFRTKHLPFTVRRDTAVSRCEAFSEGVSAAPTENKDSFE